MSIVGTANKSLHRKNLPPLRSGSFSGELRRWAPKKAMRILLAVNVLMAVTACAANASTIQARPLAVDVAAQHGALISISAWYFCTHQQWPATLTELLSFQAQAGLPLRGIINQSWVLGPEVSYRREPTFFVRSSGYYETEGWVTVVSHHAQPTCGKGTNTLNDAHVDFVEPSGHIP